MLAFPSNGVFGNAHPEFETQAATLRITRAPSGPNTGLAFLTSAPSVDHSIFLHPGLSSRPAETDTSQSWHADQDGLGSGTCTAAVFSVLTPAVERHEGVTMQDSSHWGITRNFYQATNAQRQFEQLFTNKDDFELRYVAWQVWLKLHQGTHDRQQHRFDRAEYPLIRASLHCTLDMNPNDP